MGRIQVRFAHRKEHGEAEKIDGLETERVSDNVHIFLQRLTVLKMQSASRRAIGQFAFNRDRLDCA